MKDRLWFMAFILVMSIVGLLAIDRENQWWWFIFVVPASMVIYLVAQAKYNKKKV